MFCSKFVLFFTFFFFVPSAHSTVKVMPAKTGKTKAAPTHPSYVDMVKEAIAATSKPVKGSSRVVIAKYLDAKYGKVLGSRLKSGLRLALKKAVTSGVLVQTKGSFRISKAAKKPKVKKVKKPKVKKAKKPKKAKKVKKPKAAKKVKKPKAAKKVKKVAKKASKPKKAGKPKVPKVKKASKAKKVATVVTEAPKSE